MFYEYQCSDRSCLHITVESRPVANRLIPTDCEECGEKAGKIFSIPGRAWSLKAENENYPMVNPFLSKRGEPPVVFENPGERKRYYKEHGLVDAVTPEADRPTMYTSDADVDNYKDFDKFDQPECKYIGVPDSWEDKPLGEESV